MPRVGITVYDLLLSCPGDVLDLKDTIDSCVKSFNASKWQIYKLLILKGNVKTIISSLKINISMCLIGVIMGELLVSKEGIGYLIMYGSQVFNIDLVITSVFILGIISYIMYLGVEKIELLMKKKKY